MTPNEIEQLHKTLIHQVVSDNSVATHRYALERLNYLMMCKPEYFMEMYQDGTLMEHLIYIEKQCQKFQSIVEPQMIESWELTEELKAKDPMKWVGLMNNLKHTVQQMAMEEYVRI